MNYKNCLVIVYLSAWVSILLLFIGVAKFIQVGLGIVIFLGIIASVEIRKKLLGNKAAKMLFRITNAIFIVILALLIAKLLRSYVLI